MPLTRVLLALLSAFSLAFSAYAEKANVFFVHGANMGERDARAWAAEMFKRLWQAPHLTGGADSW